MKEIILKYWQAFRLNEVILMSGFFIIGSFFAIEEFDSDTVLKLSGLVMLSFTIVLSVYSFNAAAGKAQDKNNLRLKNLWNLNQKTFLIFSTLFFLLSLVISLFLNFYCSILTIIITALWILYSHPKFGLKQKAIYGTMIHFFGQILHFIMAWIIFQDFSIDAVLIAIYFSTAFSSGHLLHEIIDFDADKESGFRTSPIVFGINKITKLLIFILSLNALILVLLAYFEIIPNIAFYCFFTASLVHLVLISFFYRNIKDKALFVRNIYRFLYFAAGIIYFLILLTEYLF